MSSKRGHQHQCWRSASSLLDLQAADYFELDPYQFSEMFNKLPSRDAKLATKPFRLGHETSSKLNVPKSHSRDHRSKNEVQSANQSCSKSHRSSIVHTMRGNYHGKVDSRYQKDMSKSDETYLIGSSTSSTNSLPSISSSPSVSPSLLCPHLTLNDILLRNYDLTNRSPHTIGLCSKCRLEPPPNFHSPLSPIFKPSTFDSGNNSAKNVIRQPRRTNATLLREPGTLRRGYSDHQVSSQLCLGSSERRMRLTRSRQDDSLDYYLKPSDLRKLQMSPTLRHSVEYIRNNSIEVARVFKIYKNGQAYDKPLRVCILRNEFPTLNHLLDHINSRQTIASGARYLFHLDGSLVYSVNELKHGHAYIVSGTRAFDFKRNKLLKEQHLSEISKNPKSIDEGRSLSLRSSRENLDPSSGQRSPKRVVKSKQPSYRQNNISKQRELMNKPTGKIVAKELRDNRQRVASSPKHYHVKAVERKSPASREISPSVPARERKKKMVSSGQQVDMVISYVSEDNLTTLKETDNPQANTEKPPRFSRAKSELGTLPKPKIKLKKNVTFFDSNLEHEPSQPVPNHNTESEQSNDVDEIKNVNRKLSCDKESSSLLALGRNEIGIQVNETIDGYLIDLPIAMPFKGEEKRDYMKRNTRRSAGRLNNRLNSDLKSGRTGARTKGKTQIVTITERQLSPSELDELRDMDRGDHHLEKHRIKSEKISLASMGQQETSEKAQQTVEIRLEADEEEHSNNSTGFQAKTEANRKRNRLDKSSTTNWQYPGGLISSASPTERPVSQNEPNETVHARVTTPTPSLSTSGDNNSLTMTYDMSNFSPIYENASETDSNTKSNLKQLEMSKLPVEGKLVSGDFPPNRNFKLTWVNGFTINDKYPENSSSMLPLNGYLQQQQQKRNQDGGLLSPSNGAKEGVIFKPSERFQNWISYSKKFCELVYPAGSLVVLWCRVTNEQRFYSKHTSSISCLTLASLDPDLAGSGQINDLKQRINASVHLWSLKSLATLRIIEDDLFRNQTIFSLELKNTLVDGYELFIAAKDEKKLSNYVTCSKLNADTHQTDDTGYPRGLVKGTKAILANQQPIQLTKLSNVKSPHVELLTNSTPNKNSTTNRRGSKSKEKQTSEDQMIVVFGRKYFELWSFDSKQSKLNQMQAENKTPLMADLVSKANTMVRMSPREFLIADSDGRLNLININCERTNSNPSKVGASFDDLKYSLSVVNLLPNNEANNSTSITCLARITGNLFMTADIDCSLKFWKINRSLAMNNKSNQNESESARESLSCVSSINLPSDLCFMCTIIVADYDRKKSTVDMYIISTNNIILFASIQLPPSTFELKSKGTSKRKVDDEKVKEEMLKNSSLSILYEGHETYVMNLVADIPKPSELFRKNQSKASASDECYFTCSIDCKICKWNGKQLIWKSMLPSACASLAVHPIGAVLAVGSADGTVYILDKLTGLLISYFPITPVCINCLSYSIDGTFLAAGCANGSIFILPVYDRGLKYKKVSIFQSPFPVISLQFSTNNQYILTSVIHGSYQELILWDLPNFRYMRENVKLTVDQIEWFDSICSGSEDVRAIWENANLDNTAATLPALDVKVSPTKDKQATANRQPSRGGQVSRAPNSATGSNRLQQQQQQVDSRNFIVNLSCHRLIRSKPIKEFEGSGGEEEEEMNFAIASDNKGYLRLFRYPCSDIKQAFYEARLSSSAVNCCRFLAYRPNLYREPKFVTSSVDGSILLWTLKSNQ